MRVFRRSCRLAGTRAVRDQAIPNYRDEKFAGDTRSPARVETCEGPRATGPERVFRLRRSGSGDPELQTGVRFSRRSRDCGGQAPALRVRKGFSACAVLPPTHWRARTTDMRPALLLLIVKILQILLQILLLSGSSKKLAINPHSMLLFSQP